MRAQSNSNGLTALAVAGSNVVLIGWNMPEHLLRAQRVLGFALKRKRSRDGDVRWLRSMKTFQSIEPDPGLGVQVSSYDHPLQTFQWADYSAEPGQQYTYLIVARCGVPGALQDGPQVTLEVKTEPIDVGTHAVFFNRGAVASQEYARRFQNRRPDEVGQAAFDWLSRGLLEGLEAFIDGAPEGSELRGAFFEFKNVRVFEALKRAVQERNVTVEILYDSDSQAEGNVAAIDANGMQELTTEREHSAGYAHNKFLILLRAQDSPKAVWTGSTNLSQNGLFGHSNNAHLVRDEAVAQAYFEYWKILKRDRTLKPTSEMVAALGPLPAHDGPDGMFPIFSPQPDLRALELYTKLASNNVPLFMTFAFGMHSSFVDVYSRDDGALRFALMEKKGNGTSYKKQAAQIEAVRQRPNVVVAVGNKVELNNFDRWLREIDRTADEQHVMYIHTKYMLVDPLGATPIVVVGSANFSEASCNKNDENMLLIKGDAQVADIYLGEFMRLFSHYAFRESLKLKGAATPEAALRGRYLRETVAWIDDGYFIAGKDRALRREYFSRC